VSLNPEQFQDLIGLATPRVSAPQGDKPLTDLTPDI
jgi:hypothetical protein